MESVIRYYDGYDEASRLTTDNARKLEFIRMSWTNTYRQSIKY
ncbi:hypothetical protein [Paenibacillus sophorae]|nr:hypothetical protein [Paenibacillus sophorae]